jgi:hypothetical protein
MCGFGGFLISDWMATPSSSRFELSTTLGSCRSSDQQVTCPGLARDRSPPARTLRVSGHRRRLCVHCPDNSVLPRTGTAIAHLRDVPGEQTYESLARKGETMSTTAMATEAYDQIDQARAEVNARVAFRTSPIG